MRKIAGALLDIGAVRVRMNPPFTWASGILSPVYCDNRMVISFPDQRRKVIAEFKRVISEQNLQFDVIGGTATAAIPWAAFLAYELDKPMIYIRPEPKDHGAGKQIEGKLEAGQKVLIVEDLISTGGSSVKAAMAVRNEGRCVVTDVLAIVSWELSESERNFRGAELNLHYIAGFTDIIDQALERADISQEQYRVVLDFKNDPRTWAEKAKS